MTDKAQGTPVWAMVGRNVRRIRDEKGLTQADLADAMAACGVPWTDVTVAKVEGGIRDVTVGELVALGYTLGALEPWELLRADGLVLLAKNGTSAVPGEAVTAWATGDLRDLRANSPALEKQYPDAAYPWLQTPPFRNHLVIERRAQAKLPTRQANTAVARVQRQLDGWMAAEEEAGRPVTLHRRRAKQAALWAAEGVRVK
jgi:transcriptional regulator with XRE-family HTH domain